MSDLTPVPYYATIEIESMDDLRELLSQGADALNWLFLSTSGTHGSYVTLDSIWPELDEYDEGQDPYITVLVIQPRTVRTFYGNIPISLEDVGWLQEQVKATVRAVEASQEGNLPL